MCEEKHELQGGEVELTDLPELVWRNANPDWIDNGILSSQAFRPFNKDDPMLSSARENKVTAEAHFKEFTEVLENQSVGIWAISVNEIQDMGLRAIYDAESDTAPSPCPVGHTSIDFREIGNSGRRKISSKLRDRAQSRGRQHPSLLE